jgi:hypothetical protein
VDELHTWFKQKDQESGQAREVQLFSLRGCPRAAVSYFIMYPDERKRRTLIKFGEPLESLGALPVWHTGYLCQRVCTENLVTLDDGFDGDAKSFVLRERGRLGLWSL